MRTTIKHLRQIVIEAVERPFKEGDAVILKKELSLPSDQRPIRGISKIDLKNYRALVIWDEDHGHVHAEDWIPLDALIHDPDFEGFE